LYFLHDVVVLKFMFAISSPDEFLVFLSFCINEHTLYQSLHFLYLYLCWPVCMLLAYYCTFGTNKDNNNTGSIELVQGSLNNADNVSSPARNLQVITIHNNCMGVICARRSKCNRFDDFGLNCTKVRLTVGLHPEPLGSYSAPQTS